MVHILTYISWSTLFSLHSRRPAHENENSIVNTCYSAVGRMFAVHKTRNDFEHRPPVQRKCHAGWMAPICDHVRSGTSNADRHASSGG